MRFSQIFALFLALLLINSSLSTNFIFNTSQNGKKLSNYVCKVTKDIIKSKTDTLDVLIGNLGGTTWTSTVDDLIGCVGHDNAVVVSDFEVSLTEKTLRKAAVVVLALGWADRDTVITLIRTHILSKAFGYKSKIILMVKSSTLSLSQRLKVLQMFVDRGFTHVTAAFINENDEIIFELFPTWNSDLIVFKNPDLVYPALRDKWKNMTGFMYKAIAYSQGPRVIIKSNVVHSALVYFLKAVAKHENAKFQIFGIKNKQDFIPHWRNRNFHISLSVGIVMEGEQPKLLTYEEDGFCALIPRPPQTTLFQSIFIKPFDRPTWLFLVLIVVCCVIVWWMFSGRGAVDSAWLLSYGMFVMFLGQGVNFSRKNRLVLAILLQLIIVMTWVLSNVYEGILTSFMIQPIYETHLKTFEELVASDHDIVTGQNFAFFISGTEAAKKLNTRLKSTSSVMRSDFKEELDLQRFTFLMTCGQTEVIFDKGTTKKDKKVSELYYLLPGKILPHLIQLEASYSNPQLERLQYYMDLSFQAGLMHIWNVFFFIESQYKEPNEDKESNEVEYLKLQDLTQVFGILLVGYVLSLLGLFIEICYHDAASNLNFKNLSRKLSNQVNRMKYKNKKQHKPKRLKPKILKVRRI